MFACRFYFVCVLFEVVATSMFQRGMELSFHFLKPFISLFSTAAVDVIVAAAVAV